MKKWEYNYIGTVNGIQDTIEALNRRGTEGWRLIQKFTLNGLTIFLVEREIPEPPKKTSH